jgi:S-layer protein
MALTNTKTVNTTGVTYDSGTFLSQNWIEQSPAGINTFAIEDNTLSSAIKVLGSDDVIYIEGNFADYQFKQNGKTVTLNNGTQKSSITMNSMTNKVQVTTTLIFLDGSVTLSNKKGSTKVSITGLDDNSAIKSQLLTTKLADVKINATDNDTAADYFAALPINDTTTYTLTTNADTFVGTSGNDLFDGAALNTLSAFDNLDGGDGTTDTLRAYINDISLAPGMTITGIEVANIQATGAGLAANVSTWTGLTSLNITDVTAGQQTITAAATTDITLTATGASNVDIVGGGASLSVTTGAGSIQVGATAVVNAFTSASFVGGTTIEIHDNATTAQDDGTTLTAVSINGNTGSVDIYGAGVTAINASNLNTAGVSVTNIDLDVAHALTLTLNNVDDSADGAATGGTVTFVDGEATLVNVASTGAASWDVTLTAAKATAVNIAADENLQFDALTAGLATTVAISGDSALVVSAHTLDASANISSTSTGAVTFTGAILAGQSYSGGAGVDTITLSATGTRAIATGAGNDTITYAGPVGTGGSIDAGTGTADTIIMTAAQAVIATGSTTFAANVSNFEVLRLSAATGAAAAINMANADGINNLSIAGATVGALTVTNAAANFTLTQRALTSFASSVALAVDTGSSDNVNLVYNAADGFTSSAAFTIANVEQLTITTTDADTTAQTAVIVTPLTATSAATVTVAGNMGISFIGGLTQTTLTSLDASGLTASGAFGGLTWTAGALAASSTIHGGAAGTNTVIFSAANTASTFVTYIGGSGADTITGSNGLNNVVTLGDGTNSFTSVGAGNNTITGGSGIDTITVGTGGNTISTAAGNDIIHIGASAGLNNVNVGTGTDTVILDAIQTASGYYTSVTGMGAGDVVDLSDVTGSSAAVSAQTSMGAAIVLGGSSSFADYLNAACAGDGNTANTIIKWFQYLGNTYITEDTSAGGAFVNGSDTVISLVGAIDLSSSTLASGVMTIV